ncbi:ABC transporter permease family protein [Cohnella faecalis]|uniref:hypothetical protein n=1 Tax=Cohnella faecalis TaxID=2315694 RepID=UPI001314D12E|nr:hypothetical protein [Cohnella faecalis]
MITLCIACLYPFAVILGTSFKSEKDIIVHGYSIFPKNFSETAYRMVLHNPKILLHSYGVTAVTTIAGALIGMWVTTAYAFVISRKDYPYRSFLAFLIFFTMLFHGGWFLLIF